MIKVLTNKSNFLVMNQESNNSSELILQDDRYWVLQ